MGHDSGLLFLGHPSRSVMATLAFSSTPFLAFGLRKCFGGKLEAEMLLRCG